MRNGAETRNSCTAAEKRNTAVAAVDFEKPQFMMGKKKCRTSQLCTGRFQCRQYTSSRFASHQSCARMFHVASCAYVRAGMREVERMHR